MNGLPKLKRMRGVALAMCVLLFAGSCRNVETIEHGLKHMPDGSLWMASLQPTCGCVSLRNRSENPIALESSYFGIERGSIHLAPNEKTRALFDWAGPDNSDFYSLNAYAVDANGKLDKTRRLNIDKVTEEYAPFVNASCNDEGCPFNGLAMNRMMDDTEELERETAQRGINYTSVITASAPQNECGCMLLSNTTPFDVTLRATFHGTETGQINLRANSTEPVAFDWAGQLDTDVYVIEGVDVQTPNDPKLAANQSADAPTSLAERPGTAMTVRLKDHVEIAGTLVRMSCGPDYAEFFNRHGTKQETVVRCPWNPENVRGLGMRVAYDHKHQLEKSGNASPATRAATPPRQ